jgi:lysophospholipase L1-like esterase
MGDVIGQVIERFKVGRRTRILAFGSSNTERFLPGTHWFDCFELAARKYGRVHTCINTGIGGDTSRGLLLRFEEDAAMYRPHLVFITIGCNDANPSRNLSIQEFESNLMELHRSFTGIDCGVVFQTYYSVNPVGCDPVHLDAFYRYTDIVRKVAAGTGAGLIDHMKRWELLRKAFPEKYLPLMRDNFHVNVRGNMLMGVDIARRFDAELGNENLDCWGEALILQRLMDELEGNASKGAA